MFKKIFYIGSFLLMGLTISSVKAQTGSLSGTVRDSLSGKSIPGANILLRGTKNGAATNVKGHYLIKNIPVGTYTVRVSFVGYKTFSESISIDEGKNVLNVKLGSNSLDLSGLVVTALGIERKKRSVGYSVQEVDGTELQESHQTNVVNALAGKVAGVEINSSSGQPGASSRITIRGNSSLLGNNQPLFVVDGLPISNVEDENPVDNALFAGGTSNRGLDIDPSIIKSVSVLKGGSATALYGSRAANGVILISTKGGGHDDQLLHVSVKSNVKWSEAIIDGYQHQYLEGSEGYYANGLPRSRGGYTEPGYPSSQGRQPSPQTTYSWGPNKDNVSDQVLSDLGVDKIQTYDPRKQFYTTGTMLENTVNLSGGTGASNYFLSINNNHQLGIVPDTKLDRTSIFAKFGSQLNDRVNVNTSLNYIDNSTSQVAQGNGPTSYLYGLNFAPISYNLHPSIHADDGTQRMYSQGYNNPFWLVNNNGFGSDVGRFISNSDISVDLNTWLTLSEKIGIDTYNDRRKSKTNVGTRGAPNGSMFDQKITRTQVNSDLTLTGSRDLNEDLNLDVLLGNNINSRYYHSNVQVGQDLSIPGFFNIANASVQTASQDISKVRLYSVYARAVFSYQEYLYLTLTGRNDWSSTLPKDNNSYFYPSASVGFIFTDAFDLSNSILSYGKIRASVAQTGNDADPYSLYTNYTQANPSDGVRGNIDFPLSNGINGYLLQSVLGNSTLKPEISNEFEVGLNLKFFQNRGSFDFTYYTKKSKNQIFQIPLSPATGYSDRIGNAGALRNHGIEITVGATPIETKNFSWDLTANFSKNTTEVEKLAPGVDNIFLGGFTDPQIRIDGEAGYGVIWGTHFQENDQGQTLIDSTSGLPKVANSYGTIGQVQPDWTGSIRTTFHYKGLKLSALFDKKHGGDILNMDLYYSTYYGSAGITEERGAQMSDPNQPGYVEPLVYDGVIQTGQGEFKPNDVKVLRNQDYYQDFYSYVDQNLVEDGSYFKLRELSLSYTLPQSLIAQSPIHSLTITGTGYNLWISSDFSYGDPEGSLLGSGNAQGFYHDVTPSTRSYTLGINISF